MCQSIGIPPISTMGFGLTVVSSLIRVPKPPANITAFIAISDLARNESLSMRDAALVIAIGRVASQCRERGWL